MTRRAPAPTAAGTIYLVRHAKAESRRRFEGDDRRRPLSAAGERQAAALAHRLVAERPDSGRPIDRVLTSAAARCASTVAPLAAAIAKPLEVLDSLMEGSDPLQAFDDLLAAAAGHRIVACSHGDVILGIIDAIVKSHDSRLEAHASKASTWELGIRRGEVFSTLYLPPPDPG